MTSVLVNTDAGSLECTRVERMVAEFARKHNRTVVRQQFPVILAYIITVHKAQGKTLDSVVLSIDETHPQPGQAYVVLSRVRRLTELNLMPGMVKRKTMRADVTRDETPAHAGTPSDAQIHDHNSADTGNPAATDSHHAAATRRRLRISQAMQSGNTAEHSPSVTRTTTVTTIRALVGSGTRDDSAYANTGVW